MTKWEYRVRVNERGVDVLNDLGKQGWELIAVSPSSGSDYASLILFFKRPLEPEFGMPEEL
jgi:hypothetical protein